jgi:hypothetical protein
MLKAKDLGVRACGLEKLSQVVNFGECLTE